MWQSSGAFCNMPTIRTRYGDGDTFDVTEYAICPLIVPVIPRDLVFRVLPRPVHGDTGRSLQPDPN
ncbi:hypothetical protein DPMN_118229 [Dreissena polymorpha]|uniref:Uncharacterized protein n=1 Tax=Dreissena polymorpha TaxID=45954 RepID=A0A9D4JQ19_DREPO|nr:hypothetical protein DPMN_118229 [Dreissena polymorpha]